MRRVVTISLSAMLLAAAPPPQPASPAQLFDAAQVWSVNLTFSPEQWAAMEPKGGGGMPFGGGGRGGFGPAMLLAPAFLKADTNGDTKLSDAEFRTLGEEWFNAWDKQKQNRLTEAQLREGVAATVQIAVPPFGGPGPGAAGGRGGPGRSFVGREGGRNGLSAAAGVEFEYVHADLDFNGTPLRNVAIRYKGNGTFMQSRGSLKRSFKIDLNKYVKGQKMGGVTRLNLHSNVTDAASMNEPLSYRLFRDGKVPAPRTTWARVYLTIPGKYNNEYLGLYSVVEDVDKDFAEAWFQTREGAILKPSTPGLFSWLGDDWSKYNQTYDPKTDLTTQQKQRVIDFAKLVTSGSDAEFAEQAAAYLDMDEVARYLALNVWLANVDSILTVGQNYYLYLHPKTNRFQIFPWDLDLSFGGMGGSSELSIMRPFRGDNRFLDRLFKLEAFRKPYLGYIAEYNGSILQAARIASLIDDTAKTIRPAIAEESAAKLSGFDKSVAGETPVPQAGGGGFGGGRGPRGTPIKAFTTPRNASVEAQLAGKSQGQEGGGFGGRGGRGGPGFDPAIMFSSALLSAMDENKDAHITRDEFRQTFAKWFTAWGGDKGPLSAEQLREGINRDLAIAPAR